MLKTIAGPFYDRKTAEDTANAIDANQCSVFYRCKRTEHPDGTVEYDEDCIEFFVERDDTISPAKIFGYNAADFLKRQYK